MSMRYRLRTLLIVLLLAPPLIALYVAAMLAARAEGIGAALTTVFILQVGDVLKILGVPDGEGWLFSSCVCFGYPTGRWAVAPRRPVHEVSYRNAWGTPVGFEVDKPLWP